MAVSLVNRDGASTYKDLLQVSNTNSGITTSLIVISDGEATDSCLYLATSATSISSSLNVSAGITGDTLDIAQYIELGSTQITEAEVGVIDGVTAGTSAANKAVVLDVNSQIDTLDVLSLSITGTGLTSSAAELNVLDGVTAGSVTASKGVVVDSNKSIGTFGGISGDTLSVGTQLLVTGVIAGGISLTTGSTINYIDTSYGADTGTTHTVPSICDGYFTINVDGTTKAVPYFTPS